VIGRDGSGRTILAVAVNDRLFDEIFIATFSP
jgi:hypothetical protein